MECTQVLNYDDDDEEEEMEGICTQMCYYLEIYTSSASRLDVRYEDLSPGFNKIGREKDRVSVHLDHPTVSRVHAQIVLEDNGLVTLEDMGSANKTWKNSSKLQPYIRYTLQGDELLKFGDIKVYLHQGSKPPIIPELGKKSPLLIPETPIVVKKSRPIIFDDDKSFIPASQSSPLVRINETCNNTDDSIILATQKGSSVLNAETQNLTDFINSTVISENDHSDKDMKDDSKSELKDDTGLFFLPTQKFDDVNVEENEREDTASKTDDIIKLKFSKKALDMDDVLNDIFSQDNNSPNKYSNETPIEHANDLSDSEPVLLSTQELLDGNECSQISEIVSPISEETKEAVDSEAFERDKNEWEYSNNSSIVESISSQVTKSQPDNLNFSDRRNRTYADKDYESEEESIDLSVGISEPKDVASNSSENDKYSLVNDPSILKPYPKEDTSFKYIISFVAHHVHGHSLNGCSSKSINLDSNSISHEVNKSLENVKNVPEVEIKSVCSQWPRFSTNVNPKEFKQNHSPLSIIKSKVIESSQKVDDPFPLSPSSMNKNTHLEEGLDHVYESSLKDTENNTNITKGRICDELESNIHSFSTSFLSHMVSKFDKINKSFNDCEDSFVDMNSSKMLTEEINPLNISKRTRSSKKTHENRISASHIKIELEDNSFNQTALENTMSSSEGMDKVKIECAMEDGNSSIQGSVKTRRGHKKKFNLISDDSEISKSMPPKKRPNRRKSDPKAEVIIPKRRSTRIKKTDQVANEVTSNELLKRENIPVTKDKPKRKTYGRVVSKMADVKDEPKRKTRRSVATKMVDVKIKVEPLTELSSNKSIPSTKNDLKNKILPKEDSTRSRSRHRFKPVLMFTGFDDTKADSKIAKELGGTLTENIKDSNLIVMDKLRRTIKMVSMVGKGVPIVDRNYLLHSKEAKYFLDPWKYLIYDEEFERQYSFVLRSTLRQAEKKPLLSELEFYVTKSVDPSPAQFQNIIECSGGKFIKDVRRKKAEKVVIISCPKDHNLYKKQIKAGFMVVSKEFLLTGLLKYELDFKTFALK